MVTAAGVSERLRRNYPEDMEMRISHEALYEDYSCVLSVKEGLL
jgi:hypothetical protein